MAEHSSERPERRPWTPEVIDEQTAGFPTRGPTRGSGQDAALAMLAAELLPIAETALRDRAAAERIVGGVIEDEPQLAVNAIRAGAAGDREAARAALVRIVRRAVLDALPPVVAIPRPEPAGREKAAAVSAARKLRPARKLPAAAEAPAPTRRRGRGRALSLALLVLLLAGLGLWRFVLEPAPDPAPTAPPLAATPDPAPAATAGNGVDNAALAATVAPVATLSDTLQLEAVEPSGEPLRPAAPPATATPVAGGGDLRVFVLYPRGEAAAGEAGEVYAALSRMGAPLVVLRDIDFAIAAPRIRYFHAADAASAQAVAERLPPLAAGWTVQDFGHVRPLPTPGTLEIYVPAP